ncbi:2OG-Fe(II) oxygenase [Algivirga pacifica]|uniref:2OG-Fe(II) oxygenase family protein n=1 Tax=Algivirga pacifica TaxID=1162670 RepID=A0ABP9D5X9_9BACT
MSLSTFTVHEEALFEELIQGMVSQKFGVCDTFLDPSLTEGLRNNLLSYLGDGKMKPAGIGQNFDYQKNAEVRGDVIKWIENDSNDPFERQFLDKVERFIQYLNSTCYTSINAYEFHYAYYEQGSFYQRHLDQFKSDKGRKFSLVTYLNEDWQPENGGKLSLYLEGEKEIEVYPIGGRSACFKADELEHEVHVSPDRYRLSIAGWLKNS